jgi:hypothetical protein
LGGVILIEKTLQLKKDLQTIRGHIFYSFQEVEKYVENAAAYIVSGIEQGDQILFIENDKLIPIIQEKLKSLLSTEQLAKVHYTNNFDFYCSKGTFHPATVFNHFIKSLEPYIENTVSIRTWGHVEWGDPKDIDREIGKYENDVDQMVSLNEITAVCAYDADRVTESLKNSLIKCHGFLMTDDEITKI